MKWLREGSRDIVALGGLPFYFLVMARAMIGVYNLFALQLAIALIFIIAVEFFVKANVHIARGFVVFAFTSIFYSHLPFTIFAFFAWLLAVAALLYLRKSLKSVLKGIVLGVVATAIANILAPLLL